MSEYCMYIDGEWKTASESTSVLSPATEEVIATVPVADQVSINTALEAAKRAQRDWSRRTGVERGDVLRKWADLIDLNRERLAKLISQEEGKPLREAMGEIDFGNSWFRYYAEFDRRIDGEILSADKPNEQLWIFRQPVGVVVGIIPWNYPMAVAVRKIAPAPDRRKLDRPQAPRRYAFGRLGIGKACSRGGGASRRLQRGDGTR